MKQIKQIKIQILVVIVTIACVTTVTAAELFEWCGSTDSVSTTACDVVWKSINGGSGFACAGSGACETTTTTYDCTAALGICSPSSCHRVVGPTVTASCTTLENETPPGGYIVFTCDCQ